MKKLLASLSIFTMLFTAMPAKKAEAGIILSPAYGVGLFFIVMGVVYDDLGLLILDENQDDVLVQEMQKNYGAYTSNPMAFEGLATMVSNAIETQGEITEETEINFTEDEILEALGPAAANEELVDAVTSDLM